MTHFIKRGNTFNIADESDLDIHKTLPVGNYTAMIDATWERILNARIVKRK